MAISQENILVCRQRFVLQQINEAAVKLRDEIGTGPIVADLRAGVQAIVELSRSAELRDEE